MTWAQQPDRSFDEVEPLLPLIRFPLMSQQELQVSSSPCHQMLQQALLLFQMLWRHCIAIRSPVLGLIPADI